MAAGDCGHDAEDFRATTPAGAGRSEGAPAAVGLRLAPGAAVAFVALAVYVWVDAAGDLAGGTRPEASLPGLLLAVASVILMPRLARAKRALAPALGRRPSRPTPSRRASARCSRPSSSSASGSTPCSGGGGPTRWPPW